MCGDTKVGGLTGGVGGRGVERVEGMLQEGNAEFCGEGGGYRSDARSCHSTLLI